MIISRVIIEKMQRPSDKKSPGITGGFYFVKVPEQLGRNPAPDNSSERGTKVRPRTLAARNKEKPKGFRRAKAGVQRRVRIATSWIPDSQRTRKQQTVLGRPGDPDAGARDRSGKAPVGRGFSMLA